MEVNGVYPDQLNVSVSSGKQEVPGLKKLFHFPAPKRVLAPLGGKKKDVNQQCLFLHPIPETFASVMQNVPFIRAVCYLCLITM